MDNAWKTLKQIVVILLIVYFVSFVIYNDFLLRFFEEPLKFDTSRYLFKILNLQ